MVPAATHPLQSAAVIDYVVDGPRTAAAVARGQARLLGVSYAHPGQEPRFVRDDVGTSLLHLGAGRRVYHDSVFGCAVELQNELPLADSFDDARIMLRLLEEPPPLELQARTERQHREGSRVAASLARVRFIGRLYSQLLDRIQADGLGNVYRQIEIPVVAPTLAMTLAGLHVNPTTLQQIEASHCVQQQITQRQLAELAGRDVNIDAPEDLAACLYDELNLPIETHAGTRERSTSNAALQSLAGAHPAVSAVVQYRTHRNIQNAAARLLAHVEPDSGQVHAELDPLGTATGRFSCKAPDLQGMPRAVLAAIEAAPGCVLMEVDVAQCELRVLAHFSKDPVLMEAYSTGDVDVHRRTAAAVLGIQEHEVAGWQRSSVGKTVNFAIIYGMTPAGLSAKLRISVAEAEQLLAAYSAAYTGVQQWIDSVHELVRANGYVRTLCGRRRQLPSVWSAAAAATSRALRQGVNTIVQGTAADLMKQALIRLHNELPPEVKMLATCHDSVLLQAPESLADTARSQAVTAMKAAFADLVVPLEVEVGVGRTWAGCRQEEVRV